jgi:predicted DNA-binding protein YlxM (UPF0122 family)
MNSITEKSQVSRQQGELELLRGRLELLAGKDRALMAMYLENGRSFRQLAQLAGVSEVNIARRIRILSARLIDGPYILCLENRDKLAAAELAVAKEYFLKGLSIRQIAANRQQGFHAIRKTVKRIKDILKVQK